MSLITKGFGSNALITNGFLTKTFGIFYTIIETIHLFSSTQKVIKFISRSK